MDKIEKLLDRLELHLQERIRHVMRDILIRNLALYQVKKLTGVRHSYRIRVGQYRIIFYMDRYEVHILDVNKRDDDTYRHI